MEGCVMSIKVNWIQADKEKPCHCKELLICKNGIIRTGFFSNDTFVVHGCNKISHGNDCQGNLSVEGITYWAELPEPPEEKQQ